MKCKSIIKGKECGREMIHHGAFETVDGIKYKSYGCPECHNIERGEEIVQETCPDTGQICVPNDSVIACETCHVREQIAGEKEK